MRPRELSAQTLSLRERVPRQRRVRGSVRSSPICLSVMLALLTATPAFSQTRLTLEQVLQNMSRVGASFRSLEASIDRTKVTVIVNDQSVDSGRVYFAKTSGGSRIKLDILKPEAQSLLIDAGVAQLYFPRIKQVQRFVLGKNQDKAEFLLIGFGQSNDEIKRAYNVTLVGEETVAGIAASVIDLQPKSTQAAAMFRTVRMWMDQTRWVPVQTRLSEASGDYLVVRFSNIKVNRGIPSSVFTLKLPKGVQVINM